MAGKLNNRQQRFVDEYLVDSNATQAAIRAGYSEKTAKQIGAENLTKLAIAAEIQARRSVMAEKLEITKERILNRLLAIAEAVPEDFMTVKTEMEQKLGIHPITGEVTMLPAGWFQYIKVIDLADIPREKQAAVASIKQGAHGIEFKLRDNVRALELLGKYLGLFDNSAAPPAQSTNLFDAIVGNTGEDMETDGISELEQEAEAGGDVVEPAEV